MTEAATVAAADSGAIRE